MIPGPWTGAVLTLAVFRLVRLAGWDDFPLAVRLRAVLLGQDDPGKPSYRRPVVAELLHCPFCVGWWFSLLVYLAWIWQPRDVLYACAPLALSGAVGLIAKNWDA